MTICYAQTAPYVELAWIHLFGSWQRMTGKRWNDLCFALLQHNEVILLIILLVHLIRREEFVVHRFSCLDTTDASIAEFVKKGLPTNLHFGILHAKFVSWMDSLHCYVAHEAEVEIVAFAALKARPIPLLLLHLDESLPLHWQMRGRRLRRQPLIRTSARSSLRS